MCAGPLCRRQDARVTQPAASMASVMGMAKGKKPPANRRATQAHVANIRAQALEIGRIQAGLGIGQVAKAFRRLR